MMLIKYYYLAKLLSVERIINILLATKMVKKLDRYV